MSFQTISQCAIDESFADRGRAAYAKTGEVYADQAWSVMRLSSSA